jgi:sugar phosphate isomerase/epimerase
MGVKGRLPFRIGATSFVKPADMLANVRFLAGRVDDIELLVFESDAMAKLPDMATIGELRRIARAESLTYTVHLPLDIWLGDGDEALRDLSVEKCVRTIERMHAVNPCAFILHCNRQRQGSAGDLTDAGWVENVGRSIRLLLDRGVEPESLCMETLDRSFAILEPVIRENKLSVCLDVGHLLLYGLDMEWYLEKFSSIARVAHLHGVIDGKDHRAVTGVPQVVLERLFAALVEKDRERIVTIEVFNESDFEESLLVMERLMA